VNSKIVKKAERQATEILVIRVITEVNGPLIGSYVDSVAPWQLPAPDANRKLKKEAKKNRNRERANREQSCFWTLNR